MLMSNCPIESIICVHTCIPIELGICIYPCRVFYSGEMQTWKLSVTNLGNEGTFHPGQMCIHYFLHYFLIADSHFPSTLLATLILSSSSPLDFLTFQWMCHFFCRGCMGETTVPILHSLRARTNWSEYKIDFGFLMKMHSLLCVSWLRRIII